jgi:hypothetical protein
MPAKNVRSNNPVGMAEAVLNLLDMVPGARSVFLEKSRWESIHLHTALIDSPEPDRWRKTRGFYEVGTYVKGAAQTDVIGDLLETMARIR